MATPAAADGLDLGFLVAGTRRLVLRCAEKSVELVVVKLLVGNGEVHALAEHEGSLLLREVRLLVHPALVLVLDLLVLARRFRPKAQGQLAVPGDALVVQDPLLVLAKVRVVLGRSAWQEPHLTERGRRPVPVDVVDAGVIVAIREDEVLVASVTEVGLTNRSAPRRAITPGTGHLE